MSKTAVNQRPAAYAPGRIVLTSLAVIAAMALGLVAGAWQWGRYDARADAAAAQEAAEGKPIAELEELVSVDTGGPEDAQWRTVTVTGVLDPDSVVELRGRTVNRTASLQYLAWMRTEAGRAVLVNLGWQPRTATATDPSLPAGEVTVTGVVRSFEADNGKPGTRINPAQMPSVDQPVVPAYVMATAVCTASDCVEELEPVPIPSLSLGPHLSYALQWWLLTAVAAPLGVWLTRRDALHERERAQEGGDDAATPRRKRAPKRRLTDEEIEDAL